MRQPAYCRLASAGTLHLHLHLQGTQVTIVCMLCKLWASIPLLMAVCMGKAYCLSR